ncbi:MAG: hypothetical protein SangKO_030020 [Sandaracinaceae bacterium]
MERTRARRARRASDAIASTPSSSTISPRATVARVTGAAPGLMARERLGARDGLGARGRGGHQANLRLPPGFQRALDPRQDLVVAPRLEHMGAGPHGDSPSVRERPAVLAVDVECRRASE